MEGAFSFRVLHKDEIYSILKELDPIDVLKFCQLETYTRAICYNTDLFKTLMMEHFPGRYMSNNPRQQYFYLANHIVSVYFSKSRYNENHEFSPNFVVLGEFENKYRSRKLYHLTLEIVGVVEIPLTGYVVLRTAHILQDYTHRFYDDDKLDFYDDFEDALDAAFADYFADIIEIKNRIIDNYPNITYQELLDEMNLNQDWDNEETFRENIIKTTKAGEVSDRNNTISYYIAKVRLAPSKGIKSIKY